MHNRLDFRGMSYQESLLLLGEKNFNNGKKQKTDSLKPEIEINSEF